MKPQDLYDDIIAYCVANQSEAIVKKYSRYFKEGYDAYGLSHELFESKIEDLIVNQNVTFQLAIDTSHLLVSNVKYEATSFAILLFKRFKKQFTPEIFDEISKWFDKGINNWGHTDVICSELIAVFLEKKIISYNSFTTWLVAVNKYKRRAVPVSLIKLLKYSNEYQPLFEFIEPLMVDPDREVHQGVGWFLREAWKKQPEATEMFLMKWRDISPRLIFQYAIEKMSIEQKLHFKKSRRLK